VSFWIAISTLYFFKHPIDSHLNTTFFLKLTGSKISLWCYFWIDFYLNIFRNVSILIGYILLTKSLLCNVAAFTGMPYISEFSDIQCLFL
jgi:hypothetical protein